MYQDTEIDRLFRLLEKAVKTKQDEISNLPSYQFSPLMTNLTSNAFHQMRNSALRIENIFQNGQRVSKAILERAQEQVEQNPWAFVGKVAVITFGVGLILGFHYQDLRGGKKG